MKKLILLTQVSIDGYLADAEGETDWMIWNWGEEWGWDTALRKYQEDICESTDCVLISRQMAEEGFVNHWADLATKSDNSQHIFALAITCAKKVVFSHTLEKSIWDNTVLAKGDLETEINKLKAETGKNMIVYGGSALVSSLIAAGVIDEFHLVVNPMVLGNGLPVFKNKVVLSLIGVIAYECGISVLKYKA